MVLENWEKDRKRNQFWEETYNMTAILFSALAALGGGLVMGVTGFGAGMVIMMVLPVFYSLTESAASPALSALSSTPRWRSAIGSISTSKPSLPPPSPT